MDEKEVKSEVVLKCKSSAVLLSELKSLVEKERKLLVEILHYLKEVDARKLHLEIGYPDLYTFAMNELGYSSGAAHRRISAMRLMVSVPEVGQKLECGDLCLQNATQAQGYFRRARSTTEEKRDVLESLYGQSTRAAKRILTERLPDAAPPQESSRPVPGNQTKIEFVASAELMEKLERLKGFLAHQNYDGRMDRLVEILANMALKKFEPSQTPAQGVDTRQKKARFKASPQPDQTETQLSSDNAELEQAKSQQARSFHPKRRSRYIRKTERYRVKLRDTEGCTYRDPESGRVCGSKHGLQLDHRILFSRGGPNTAENLRLLCGAHNQYRAWKLGFRVRRMPKAE